MKTKLTLFIAIILCFFMSIGEIEALDCTSSGVSSGVSYSGGSCWSGNRTGYKSVSGIRVTLVSGNKVLARRDYLDFHESYSYDYYNDSSVYYTDGGYTKLHYTSKISPVASVTWSQGKLSQLYNSDKIRPRSLKRIVSSDFIDLTIPDLYFSKNTTSTYGERLQDYLEDNSFSGIKKILKNFGYSDCVDNGNCSSELVNSKMIIEPTTVIKIVSGKLAYGTAYELMKTTPHDPCYLYPIVLNLAYAYNSKTGTYFGSAFSRWSPGTKTSATAKRDILDKTRTNGFVIIDFGDIIGTTTITVRKKIEDTAGNLTPQKDVKFTACMCTDTTCVSVKSDSCKTGKTNSKGIVEFDFYPLSSSKAYGYKITETVPDGYKPKSRTSKIKAYYGGIDFTVDFVNVKEVDPTCDTELQSIKSKYKLDGNTPISENFALSGELIELAKKYPDSRNGLLNFNLKSLDNITCDADNSIIRTNNLVCNEEGLKYDAYTNRTSNPNFLSTFYSFYNETNPARFTSGDVTAYCTYKITSTPGLINSNGIGSKTYAGGLIWKANSPTDSVFSAKIAVQCVSYYPNTSANTASSENVRQTLVNRYTGDWFKESIDLLGPDIEHFEKNVIDDTEFKDGSFVTTSNGYARRIWQRAWNVIWSYGDTNKIQYDKIVGSLNSTGFENVIGTFYGIPTSLITKSGSKDFTITLNGELKDFFNSDQYGIYTDMDVEATASCNFETECRLVDCPGNDEEKKSDLNLAFRIIDTNDTKQSFPSISGLGRNTGSNWCDGKNCSYNNELVNKKVVQRNDSKNKNGQAPLISITLNSSNINQIREYNKGHSYTSVEMDCENGANCKSSFVTNLLNGTYGSLGSISCETGNNRNYCVGG